MQGGDGLGIPWWQDKACCPLGRPGRGGAGRPPIHASAAKPGLLGVSYHGPKNIEVPGIVDGCLYPEIGPLLIVA